MLLRVYMLTSFIGSAEVQRGGHVGEETGNKCRFLHQIPFHIRTNGILDTTKNTGNISRTPQKTSQNIFRRTTSYEVHHFLDTFVCLLHFLDNLKMLSAASNSVVLSALLNSQDKKKNQHRKLKLLDTLPYKVGKNNHNPFLNSLCKIVL